MTHFLLIYDVRHRRLVSPPREFSTPEPAIEAYEAAEHAHRGDRWMQVVLVAAQSLDDVKVTHGNFFHGEDLDRLVARLLDTDMAVDVG